jgi:hypothetical protein
MKTWIGIGALMILFLSSCGKEGKAGVAYLALDWDWYVDSYWDDNPGIPNTIQKNREYNVSPNTYSFQYACSDGTGNAWNWSGTYTIRINPGGQKRTFKDGENGKNRHYLFLLTGLSRGQTTVTEKNNIQKEERPELSRLELPIPEERRNYIGQKVYHSFSNDNFSIDVEMQMFTVE